MFMYLEFHFYAFLSQAEPKSEKVSPFQMNYEAKNLKKQEQYEFWVTASTNVGEGQPSKTITVAPNSRGQYIADFSVLILYLFCRIKLFFELSIKS